MLEEISLRDQWQWVRQLVEVLSEIDTGGVVNIVRLWATDLQDACRDLLNEIGGRLAVLENLLEEFGEGD